MNDLTPALFHNTIFCFEIFSKAYLSLNNVSFANTHKLSEMLHKVKETMFRLNHNDTLFHAHVIYSFENIVKYINTIPGVIKEQNVKYEDNSDDFTVIRFVRNELISMKDVITMSNDFIMDFYYNKESGDVLFLKQGLYKRLLAESKNDDDRQRVINAYGFLLSKV